MSMMATNAKNISNDEFFFGHKACAGCGGSLALRIALKVLGKDTIVMLPAGCMSAVGFNFPQLCFSNNAMITPFASTAAVASGVAAGLKSQGIETRTHQVIGFAGDGGTADIGIQALSGAIDRNDDIIYFCYDNEAYMNTGIQKSGLTPKFASTTTTPFIKDAKGSLSSKKNLFEIVASHDLPYAATASVGYLSDYIKKIEKAASIRGTKFIHVLAPCPTGWGYDVSETMNVAREVVDCGLWYLAEFEGSQVCGKPMGNFKVTYFPRKLDNESVGHYLLSQKRFSGIEDEDINAVEKMRDDKWEFINKNWSR